jgi:hypothetical protein
MGLLGFRLTAAVSVHEPSKLMYRHNKSLQTASCDNQDVFPVSVRETKLFTGLRHSAFFLQKNGRFLVINGFYSQGWRGAEAFVRPIG